MRPQAHQIFFSSKVFHGNAMRDAKRTITLTKFPPGLEDSSMANFSKRAATRSFGCSTFALALLFEYRSRRQHGIASGDSRDKFQSHCFCCFIYCWISWDMKYEGNALTYGVNKKYLEYTLYIALYTRVIHLISAIFFWIKT